MQRRLFVSTAALGLALASAAPAAIAQEHGHAGGAAPAAPFAPRLHAALQDLWHGHIEATRDYALAVHAGDSAGADAAKKAEVANGHQLADAVAGFYGKDAGEGIFKLLAGHVGGVNALTDAVSQGDKDAAGQAMGKLAANAMDIAKFLAGANPDNWTVDALNGALLAHVGHHKQQIDLIMADAPQAEQDKAWTQMQEHMDMIATVLANGIANQFPDKIG